jgi:hypothetical protein
LQEKPAPAGFVTLEQGSGGLTCMPLETFVFGGVIALILAVLVTMARRDRRARDLRTSHWASAQGEVLEVWQDGTGSFCVRYRFTPRGTATPITRDEIAGCFRAALPDVGARVPVRYDPEAPMRAQLQGESC